MFYSIYVRDKNICLIQRRSRRVSGIHQSSPRHLIPSPSPQFRYWLQYMEIPIRMPRLQWVEPLAAQRKVRQKVILTLLSNLSSNFRLIAFKVFKVKYLFEVNIQRAYRHPNLRSPPCIPGPLVSGPPTIPRAEIWPRLKYPPHYHQIDSMAPSPNRRYLPWFK